ncbi:GtrA family protein [Polynucleobacter rarus]|uniref:GtrA family protein n=1 Tax=Polynucleobacter rarus TaxID=556055 RepID=UPI000D3E6A62
MASVCYRQKSKFNKIRNSLKRSFFSFLFIGGLTFLIYWAVLWLLFKVERISYPYVIMVAYSTSITFHFFANRRHTFYAHTGALKSQIPKYIVLAATNYFIQLSIIYIFYGLCNLNFYIVTLFAIVITMISGYFFMEKWIFRGGYDNCS